MEPSEQDGAIWRKTIELRIKQLECRQRDMLPLGFEQSYRELGCAVQELKGILKEMDGNG